MTKLRCWPGAVCHITKSDGYCDELIGRTITVTKRADQDHAWSEPVWYYEGEPFILRSGQLAGGKVLALADAMLTPITPPPGVTDHKASQERVFQPPTPARLRETMPG